MENIFYFILILYFKQNGMSSTELPTQYFGECAQTFIENLILDLIDQIQLIIWREYQECINRTFFKQAFGSGLPSAALASR